MTIATAMRRRSRAPRASRPSHIRMYELRLVGDGACAADRSCPTTRGERRVLARQLSLQLATVGQPQLRGLGWPLPPEHEIPLHVRAAPEDELGVQLVRRRKLVPLVTVGLDDAPVADAEAIGLRRLVD